MKSFLVLISLFVAQNVSALDITFKVVDERKDPVVAMMVCSGQSCACPADTVLNQTQMRCLKCDAGLELDKDLKCVDPKAPTEETVRDWTAVGPQTQSGKALMEHESNTPSLCDITKVVDGKFTDCQCPSVTLDVLQLPTSKMAVTIQKTFNRESQKCERSQPYIAKVPNISCYGPKRGGFQNLEATGLIKVSYDAPDFTLGSCGVTDGTHIFELQRSENMLSLLDAIVATTSMVTNRSIKSFEIDPKSLNY